MDSSNKVISGLWIGNKLPTISKLCIKSYLAAGHKFRLYVWDKVEGVPKGVEIADVREIMPHHVPSHFGHPAYYSELFRVKLLLDKGGWWVDMDTVCLKPFDFQDEILISTERGMPQGVGSGFIKAIPGLQMMQQAWEKLLAIQHNLRWNEAAFQLTEAGAARFGKPFDVFCPINWWQAVSYLDEIALPEESYAVHLWAERWRIEKLDTESKLGFYGKLRAKFKV